MQQGKREEPDALAQGIVHATADTLPESTMPKNFDDLIAFLDTHGIATNTIAHAPLFTVADSQRLRGEIAGGHTKNLFVKDKKGAYFLMTVEEDAVVDLKTVHTVIGASGRVSFGSAEKLMELLGVIPGAVTPFGVINDTGGAVTMVFDAALMRHETINAHPLVNDKTTSIRSADLLQFVRLTGHEPRVLTLTA